MSSNLARHAVHHQVLASQPDPRKPKRPEGDAGSNWAYCRDCSRGAPAMKLIRHSAICRSRNP